MIGSILRRVEALEKRYPKPSAGEMANKKLAAYLRSNPFLRRYVKDLVRPLCTAYILAPPTEMDNQQIADFIRSRGFSIFCRVSYRKSISPRKNCGKREINLP
jgi:hypothetical protein